MASTASPARPVLGNLAVNSTFTPRMKSFAKPSMPRKRPIDEVDEPENASAARPMMLSQSHCTDARLAGQVSRISLHLLNVYSDSRVKGIISPTISLSPSPSTPIETNIPPALSTAEDDPSPRSNPSSMIEDDLDDTMESQQTAATEFTQPIPSGQFPDMSQPLGHRPLVTHVSSLSTIPQIKEEKDLTRDYSTSSSFGSASVWRNLKSKQTKPLCHSPNFA